MNPTEKQSIKKVVSGLLRRTGYFGHRPLAHRKLWLRSRLLLCGCRPGRGSEWSGKQSSQIWRQPVDHRRSA